MTTRPFAERLVLVTLYSKDDWFSARLTEGVQGENFSQEQKLADDTRDSVAVTVPGATGGCAFLAGGAVQGGRVIADWPGHRRKAVLDGRGIRPTLDLRSVFKAVLADHIRIDARALTARVFPNSQGAPPLHGLLRA